MFPPDLHHKRPHLLDLRRHDDPPGRSGRHMLLNAAETEFNIMLGLCVGHDSLFMKYSEAPCTVLAVKDRLLGHNPLAAVYTLESYSRYLK